MNLLAQAIEPILDGLPGFKWRIEETEDRAVIHLRSSCRSSDLYIQKSGEFFDVQIDAMPLTDGRSFRLDLMETCCFVSIWVASESRKPFRV